MVKKYNPKIDERFKTTDAPGTTGEALYMAERAGAQLVNMGYILGKDTDFHDLLIGIRWLLEIFDHAARVTIRLPQGRAALHERVWRRCGGIKKRLSRGWDSLCC